MFCKSMVLKKNDKATHLEITVIYSLGGVNMWNHQNEPRGYYLHVAPVTIERGWTRYTAWSGGKQLIKEVMRKSAKAEKEAEEIAQSVMHELIEWVCEKNGIEVEEG